VSSGQGARKVTMTTVQEGPFPFPPTPRFLVRIWDFFFVFLMTAILIGDPGVVLIAFLSWIRMLTFLRLFASYLLFFSENCLFN
jgi:hypothetical protein